MFFVDFAFLELIAAKSYNLFRHLAVHMSTVAIRKRIAQIGALSLVAFFIHNYRINSLRDLCLN